MYFSGPTKQNNPLLKDKKKFSMVPLKYTSFFKVRKNQLVYFGGPENSGFGVH